MIPNLLDGGVRPARLKKNCDPGHFPVAVLMHQVDFHIVWLSVNVLFAGTVKVELRELVTLFSNNQKVSTSRGVVIVHSDRVAVVNYIFEWPAFIFKSYGRKIGFLRILNVDRRLFL